MSDAARIASGLRELALLAEVFSSEEGAVDEALRGLAAEGHQTAP